MVAVFIDLPSPYSLCASTAGPFHTATSALSVDAGATANEQTSFMPDDEYCGDGELEVGASQQTHQCKRLPSVGTPLTLTGLVTTSHAECRQDFRSAKVFQRAPATADR